MERLFSPWRLRYVSSGRRKSEPCVFCSAIRKGSARSRLVLYRGHSNYVILNKYPYNNGHLMIVPIEHHSSPQEASDESLAEMMQLLVRCEAVLRRVYRPSGINLGMNLGRSAGAGIEEHYHLHLVPRWDGDTNFMTVVRNTRVIPEALAVSYRRLRPLFRGAGDRPARAPSRRRHRARRRSTR
jgi:ATP adenylyltransferase